MSTYTVALAAGARVPKWLARGQMPSTRGRCSFVVWYHDGRAVAAAGSGGERTAEAVRDCVDQLINARALPHGVLIEFFEFEGCSAHALIAANSF